MSLKSRGNDGTNEFTGAILRLFFFTVIIMLFFFITFILFYSHEYMVNPGQCTVSGHTNQSNRIATLFTDLLVLSAPSFTLSRHEQAHCRKDMNTACSHCIQI